MNWLRKDSGQTAKAIYYCHKSRFTLSNWTQLHGGILMTGDHVFCPQIIFIKWTRKAIESAQVVLLWYSASAVKRVVLYYHEASIKEWTIDIYCLKRAFKARILRNPLRSRFTSIPKCVSRAMSWDWCLAAATTFSTVFVGDFVDFSDFSLSILNAQLLILFFCNCFHKHQSHSMWSCENIETAQCLLMGILVHDW